jgi:hypothetical protein
VIISPETLIKTFVSSYNQPTLAAKESEKIHILSTLSISTAQVARPLVIPMIGSQLSLNSLKLIMNIN